MATDDGPDRDQGGEPRAGAGVTNFKDLTTLPGNTLRRIAAQRDIQRRVEDYAALLAETDAATRGIAAENPSAQTPSHATPDRRRPVIAEDVVHAQLTCRHANKRFLTAIEAMDDEHLRCKRSKFTSTYSKDPELPRVSREDSRTILIDHYLFDNVYLPGLVNREHPRPVRIPSRKPPGGPA